MDEGNASDKTCSVQVSPQKAVAAEREDNNVSVVEDKLISVKNEEEVGAKKNEKGGKDTTDGGELKKAVVSQSEKTRKNPPTLSAARSKDSTVSNSAVDLQKVVDTTWPEATPISSIHDVSLLNRFCAIVCFKPPAW